MAKRLFLIAVVGVAAFFLFNIQLWQLRGKGSKNDNFIAFTERFRLKRPIFVLEQSNESLRSLPTSPEKKPTLNTSETHRITSNIVYLKIPKTGSSTIRAIFHRFCDKYNVTCAPLSPRQHDSRWSSIEIKEATITRSRFDIFPPHFYYNRPLMDKFMPGAINVVSIREPISRVISDFYYHQRSFGAHKNITLETWIDRCYELAYPPAQNRSVTTTTTTTTTTKLPHVGGHFLLPNPEMRNLSRPLQCDRNTQVAYMSSYGANSETALSLALANLIQGNFIVLPLERFDESLIYLGYKLHWDLDDLVYLSLKVAKVTDTAQKKLSANSLAKLSKLNSMDIHFYQTALQYYERAVAPLRNQSWFQERLAMFTELHNNISTTCSPGSVSATNIDFCWHFLVDEIEWLRKDSCIKVASRLGPRYWAFWYKEPSLTAMGRENYRINCLLPSQAERLNSTRVFTQYIPSAAPLRTIDFQSESGPSPRHVRPNILRKRVDIAKTKGPLIQALMRLKNTSIHSHRNLSVVN